MASGWNLWVWLECIGVVIIIITFPYSTCISSFFGSSIPISLFIFKCFFVLVIIMNIIIMFINFVPVGLAYIYKYMCVDLRACVFWSQHWSR